MKIAQKLLVSFTGLSLLTGVGGVMAVVQGQKIAENLAIAEAQHVAEVMATSIIHIAIDDRGDITSKKSAEL